MGRDCLRCARLELRSSSLREVSSACGEWRMGRDWSPGATCLTARTTNVDFGFLPSPLRGRLAVGLCRGAALSSPEGFKVRLRRNGGWGGIACAALRLSRCARLELRSHPSEKFQAPAARWRMGRDSNPRCIAAHTLSKRAHSTTLPPILEQGKLNTMVGRAARRQQAFARFAVQALMAVMEGGQRCFRVRFTV